MSADVEVVRLGPFGGLSGLRVADEVSLGQQSPLPMRGGYNVEVVDGEWWVRPGYDFADATRQKFGSVPWWGIVGTDNRDILWSPWYALEWNRSTHTVDNIYTPRIASESITFTLGSASAVSTTNPLLVGDMILTGGSGNTTGCYVIVAVSGTAITLDRVAEHNGATTCRIIDSITGASPFDDTVLGGDNPNSDRAAFALVDQLVTHAADAVYSGSPAVTAGEQYMVITSQSGSPVAFRTDGGGALLTGWFRDTSKASPSTISNGDLCCSQGNRLIIGYADDPGGDYETRTIWHSWPGDFILFHTGVAGQNADPHFVTFDGFDDSDAIKALVPLGERLVVHRRWSQEVGYPQGTSVAPYTWTRLNVGTGLVGTRAIVEINQVHYMMTDRGLAAFDGQAVTPIVPELQEHMRSMEVWQDARFIQHDPDALRLYIFQSGSKTQRHQSAAIPATANVTPVAGKGEWVNARPVLVYDYSANTAWFEDHVSIVGGGSVNTFLYFCRFDGTIMLPNTDAGSGTGFDRGVTTGTHTVDALAETPWMFLGGHVGRARLQRVVVGLRALDLTTGGFSSITDLWTLATETVHLCTLDVCTEGNPTAAESQDLAIVASTMLALSPDENQQMPVMEFVADQLHAAGRSFKFRFKNALSSAATAAGYTKGMFRIAYIEVYFVRTETGVPLVDRNVA